MVNGRMRASGASVKMAVGGLAIGNFGDVTKVDGIIKQLMTAANKDPALMEKLASKGIMVNKTGADKKSAEMQQANKPQEPIEAAEGTYVSPFDFGNYGTLGGGLFAAAGIKDPEKAVEETFFKPEGKIQQIVLVGPNGEEIPIAWNSAVPLEEFIKGSPELKGFTRKVISPTTVSPVAVSTQDTRPRQTGDDSDTGGGDEPPTTATPFNYRDKTIEELEAKYKQTQMFSDAGTVASVVAGPVGLIIGIAAKANHQIVKRRIEIELDRRVEEEKLDPDSTFNSKGTIIGGPEVLTIQSLINTVSTKPKGKGTSSSFLKSEFDEAKKGLFNLDEKQNTGVVDKFLDKFAQNAADKITAEVVDNNVDPNSGLLMNSGTTDTKAKTSLEKVTDIKKSQEAADFRREEKVRKEEEAAEASRRAQAAAQAAANARRRAVYDSGKLSDGSDNSFVSRSNEMQATPGVTRADRGVSRTASDYNQTGGQRTSTSSGTEGLGFLNTGGLVSMPAAKKKKKQTTQRRKGLGTRP